MAAPCINDTCSIEAVIDPATRRLSLNVLNSVSGGISCDNGLEVQILGDPAPAAAIDTDFQQLGIEASGPNGKLWSIPKRAKRIVIPRTNTVDVPLNGASSAEVNSAAVIVNPFSSPAMAIAHIRLRVGYTIEQVAEAACLETANNFFWVPYSAAILAPVLFDGDTAGSVPFDIGGVHLRDRTPHNRRQDGHIVRSFFIGANATVVVKATAAVQLGVGNNPQTDNILLDTDLVFTDRGFSFDGEVVIFPFGGS